MDKINAASQEGLSPLPRANTLLPKQEDGSSFQKLFTGLVHKVNDTQIQAEQMVQKLTNGEKVNPHEVMLRLEEANIVLQFTLQVRNKAVEAYKEVMRMQI